MGDRYADAAAVIDTLQNKVIAIIPIGQGPQGSFTFPTPFHWRCHEQFSAARRNIGIANTMVRHYYPNEHFGNCDIPQLMSTVMINV
jgi:YVTN family beta-propeller protein